MTTSHPAIMRSVIQDEGHVRMQSPQGETSAASLRQSQFLRSLQSFGRHCHAQVEYQR